MEKMKRVKMGNAHGDEMNEIERSTGSKRYSM